MAFEITNLIGAFFVIALWSLLFKDSVFYKFAERTYVGVGIGIIITETVNYLQESCLSPIMNGDYLILVPIILGILMLTKLTKEFEWLSRYPMALMAGTGLALMTRTAMQAQILGQIKPIVTVPLITSKIDTTLGNIYAWLGFIGGVSFFIFATEGLPAKGKQILEPLRKIGRYVIMLMLGTYFANILMGRSSAMLERVLFLLQTFGIVR